MQHTKREKALVTILLQNRYRIRNAIVSLTGEAVRPRCQVQGGHLLVLLPVAGGRATSSGDLRGRRAWGPHDLDGTGSHEVADSLRLHLHPCADRDIAPGCLWARKGLYCCQKSVSLQNVGSWL